MKKNILLFAAIGFLFSVNAQQVIPEKCITTDYMNAVEAKNPGYIQRVNNAFDANIQSIREGNNNKTDQEYVIPVVVHIVYKKQIENLHDSLIYSQISLLNRDYNALNSDTAELRAIFKPYRGVTNIRFRLATIDPDGNPTTGITRTQTSIETFSENDMNLDFDMLERVKSTALGGQSPWDQTKYLNIWICNMSLNLFNVEIPALLGYATPPAGLANWPADEMPDLSDGVVLQYQTVGEFSPFNPISVMGQQIVVKGRTATHEVGHYLGLRHIWGDGDCNMEDGIDDTPNANDASSQSCDKTKNTCVDNIDGVDLPDLVENFMDYSLETCMNMFTKGQVNLMRSVLENQRYDLVHGNLASVSKLDKMDVSVYPNPAKNNIVVKTDVLMKGELSIVDVMGRVVFITAVDANQKTIDISSLEQGLYSIVYEGAQISKFVKQ